MAVEQSFIINKEDSVFVTDVSITLEDVNEIPQSITFTGNDPEIQFTQDSITFATTYGTQDVTGNLQLTYNVDSKTCTSQFIPFAANYSGFCLQSALDVNQTYVNIIVGGDDSQLLIQQNGDLDCLVLQITT